MHRRAKFAAISVGLIVFILPVLAAPAMQEAMAEYKSGHYAPALQRFEQLEKQYPNSAMVHYYAGLCKQGMGQINDAKNEYQWVSEHGDPQLKGLADTGLSHLGKYSSSVAGNPSAPPPPPPAAKPDKAAGKTMAAVPGAAGATAGKQKVKRVVAFVTNWDRNCNIFQPVFDETKSQPQFKDIQFVRVDFDENAELAKKYGVTAVPTIVYLDEKDKVLDTSTTAPSASEAFADKIKQVNEKK
jgi:thiol-disulfide isomerase/thioredoxin